MSMQKKHIWTQPWGYIESFLIVFALIIVAFLLETMAAKPAPTIMYPINILALLFLANCSILIFFLAKKHKTIQWFTQIPASVGAISFFILVSLIMALVPQNPNAQSYFFLYKVTSSWVYYIAVAYLLIILGVVTIRRLSPCNKKNIAFALNHLGLWITIAAASFGAGDIQKYSMYLKEGETTWQAFNNMQHPIELDFAIKLTDFTIEEYPAKIAIIHARDGNFEIEKGKKAIFEADTINGIRFRNYTISIKKFLPTSIQFENSYFPISDIGATQSYLIEVENNTSKTKDSAWIASPSITQKASFYYLPDSLVIAMLEPEAKRFASDITIYNKNGEVTNTVIEVNKPIQINSWKVYQTGYDTQKGRWSEMSILEIVKDPWLPFVYFGIFLLIAGSLYMVWVGRLTNKQE